MYSNYRRLTVINMKKLKELNIEIVGGQIVQRVIADVVAEIFFIQLAHIVGVGIAV